MVESTPAEHAHLATLVLHQEVVLAQYVQKDFGAMQPLKLRVMLGNTIPTQVWTLHLHA